MTESSRRLCGTGAIWGALGLILCAFAAHGVDHPREALWLRLGGICMLVHAVMVILIANLVPTRSGRVVAGLFLIGSAVFAGTLAAMTLGAPRWLGAVTPAGGLTMLSGWFLLAWVFFRAEPEAAKTPGSLH